MRTTQVVLLVVLVVFATAFIVASALGQSGGIVVDGADDTLEWTTGSSQTLWDLVSAVETRFVVNYANTLRYINLSPMPSALQTFVAQVGDRFVILWANTRHDFSLHPISDPLKTLVAGVQDRPIILWANTTRHVTTQYPLDLIADTQSPIITEIMATETTTGTTRIEWRTDEFADSVVEYGVKSGQYTHSASDPLYTKGHRVQLSGLSENTVYYFVVYSTDRSGNQKKSPEQSFKTTLPRTYIYVPVVVR